MGYNLYITRRRRWSDQGRDISKDEWDLSSHEHHLGDTCYWSQGNIEAKNPTDTTIARMLIAAKALRARVVGEEDEEYTALGCDPLPYRLSLMDRIEILWQKLKPLPKVSPAVVDFAVGDRVIDAWKNVGEVIELDCTCNHGLGRVVVRFPRGERTYAAAASGLTKVPVQSSNT